MLLSHNEIQELLDNGVVTGTKDGAVNATSLDLHLGDTIMVENDFEAKRYVDFRAREPLGMTRVTMDGHGYFLRPGQFILAQSLEVFHLPNNVSGEYKLKSSMARIGLEHLNAGWCDAGWHGSVLTLELKNMTNHHSILIRPGDAIGQIVFFRHAPVSDEASYATRGRYNKDTQVTAIKQ